MGTWAGCSGSPSWPTGTGPHVGRPWLQPGWFESWPHFAGRCTVRAHANPAHGRDNRDVGGLTKRLDRMEEAGLLVRRPDPDDRRGNQGPADPTGADGDRPGGAGPRTQRGGPAASPVPTDRRTLDRLLRRLLADFEAAATDV